MKGLLIIEAGGHGKVVAEDIGYKHIAFLDDNAPEAIGKIFELENTKINTAMHLWESEITNCVESELENYRIVVILSRFWFIRALMSVRLQR